MASSSTVARSRQLKGQLDSEDALALRAAELSAWARRNVRMIIGIAAVALVVVGGLLVWKYSAAQNRAAAGARLLELSANPATMTAAGSRELDTFIRQYDGTPEANEARLLLAQVRLDAGQAPQAVTLLRPVADGRSPLAVQAAMMLGSAHAQAGDRAAAIRAYQQAADRAELDFQKIEALGQAAAQHEAGGNHKAAIEIYRNLLTVADKGSEVATSIEMRLAEALARSGGR